MKSFVHPLRAAMGMAAALLLFDELLPSLRATDVNFYSVSKGILLMQTNAGAPQIHSGYPYLFQASVVPVSNALVSATVQWSGFTRALGPRFGGAPYTFTDRLQTQSLLDLFYPNGNFTVAMTTMHDGARSAALNLTGANYPVAPTVVNYAAAQSIDSSNDFTLRWNSFVGGTNNDFIFVQIDSGTGTGVLFRTSYTPGTPGALNGTNTALVIPANTLAPSHAYAGRIAFMKVVATNSSAYPGVTGTAAYFTQTDFFIATAGSGDVTPPMVASVSPADGATNVPLNAPFVMNFNEPMRQSFSLFISGTLAGRTFAWSPDGLTLVATPISNWPPNTTIGWILNPSDGLLLFADLNRNPLPMETAFRFTTGTNAVPPESPVLSEPVRLVNGRFQFNVLGEPNRSYVAQASTNLTNWISIGTNIAFGGMTQFVDTNAPTLPHRFYRALAP